MFQILRQRCDLVMSLSTKYLYPSRLTYASRARPVVQICPKGEGSRARKAQKIKKNNIKNNLPAQGPISTQKSPRHRSKSSSSSTTLTNKKVEKTLKPKDTQIVKNDATDEQLLKRVKKGKKAFQPKVTQQLNCDTGVHNTSKSEDPESLRSDKKLDNTSLPIDDQYLNSDSDDELLSVPPLKPKPRDTIESLYDFVYVEDKHRKKERKI